jgi:xanthine dehydrogenase molybdopterin-binding subunit B
VKAIELDFEVLPALTTIDQAIAANSWLGEPHLMQRGDAEGAMKAAPLRLRGEVRTGGQDHFYLETHCTLAIPEEGPAA